MELYHGADKAVQAEEAFDALFKKHEIPDDVAEFSVEFVRNDQGLVYLPKLMVEIKLSASTGDARRLIDGGGVKINGEALAPKSYNVDPDLLDHAILQAGKRRFAKLV